jgi:hypothetical protein
MPSSIPAVEAVLTMHPPLVVEQDIESAESISCEQACRLGADSRRNILKRLKPHAENVSYL